jgi:hypothetical protein
LELFNVSSIQLARISLEEDTRGSVGRARIFYQDLFTDPSPHNQGSLDVDGYVKSMEAIWRRLNDVNMKLPENLVVLMTPMGLRPSFGTQRIFLKSQKED